jgi:hypothetical protein
MSKDKDKDEVNIDLDDLKNVTGGALSLASPLRTSVGSVSLAPVTSQVTQIDPSVISGGTEMCPW